MSDKKFQLYFAGNSTVELVETLFSYGIAELPKMTVRGKTHGVFKSAGTFQWTSAVRGLCVLCIKSIIAHKYPATGAVGYILGFQGSLAASLDYAISKQPVWLKDMFGTDASDNSYARRLLCRTNPERKRHGPVIVGHNERALPAGNIHIFWNGELVQSMEPLQQLLLLIAGSEKPLKSKKITSVTTSGLGSSVSRL